MSNEDIKVVSKKKPEVNDSSRELISNSETPIDIYSGIKKKKTIIKSLRDLVNGQEDQSTFKNVKKLQTEWKNIGQLDNPKDKTLWTTYNALLDRFYDNRSIYFELKELDRKKNLELKIKLCDKAEKLINNKNIMKSVSVLNNIHNDFKHIGPAPVDKQEALWNRLKSASDELYKNKKKFISNIKNILNENLDKKNELLIEIKSFSNLKFDAIKEWNNKSKEILILKDKWNSIGGTPRKNSKLISKEFWTSFKGFYNDKSNFFKKIDDLYLSNLKIKNSLIKRVEDLKDSDDWIGSSKEIKSIQKEWKTVGKVPLKKKDQIYRNFKKVCDHFFDRKRVEDKDSIKLHNDNFNAKNKICDTILKLSKKKEFNQEEFLELQITFLELGHVPKESINTIKNKYKDSLQILLKSASKFMDSTELNKFKFIIEINNLSNNPFSKNKIYKKKIEIRNKINTIQSDIKNLKNNIDFLKESETANNLKKEYLLKIEGSDKEIDSLKLQLNLINKV